MWFDTQKKDLLVFLTQLSNFIMQSFENVFVVPASSVPHIKIYSDEQFIAHPFGICVSSIAFVLKITINAITGNYK